MSLGVLERLRILVTADAHGMLEQLEERALLVKQALREAELALREKETRCEALREECARLQARLDELEEAEAERDADVSLALQSDQQELARFATRALLALRQQRTLVGRELGALCQARDKLALELETDLESLRALRSRARASLARSRQDESSAAPAEEVSEADVELELLRRRGNPEDAR